MKREAQRTFDVRAHLKSFFNTAAGKRLLNPHPVKEVDKRGKVKYRHINPMMAQAFYEAAHEQ